MKRYLILIVCLIFWGGMKGQNVGFIDDTLAIFHYGNLADDKDIDSTVYFLDFDKRYNNWIIYFDYAKQHLAYQSNLKGDTCIMINYWRNGNIKERTIYAKGKFNLFEWYSEEEYCKNGQLIFKDCPIQTEEKKLVLRYYCSGQLKMKWWIQGHTADGLFTQWYENGKIKSEWNFVNKKQEGEWKYWDESGKLQKIEIYKEGKLIETK
jgi:antitoxin component YwqK of YwqJK toxin-antitoxin module